MSDSEVTLSWTSPEDDGITAQYDVRYLESTRFFSWEWTSANQADVEPLPRNAGEAEAFTITGLSPNAKYSFALKTQDQAGNWSDLSNVAVSDPAPAAVRNLAVRALTPFSVTLTWSAPGGDGTFGAAAEYDVRFSTSMIDEANWNEAVQVVGESVPRNSMAAETLVINALVCNTIYYCALKTRDSPTTAWSLLSNVANSTTRMCGEDMVLISPGTFIMGTEANGLGENWDERRHQVTLSRPFYVSDHEVTQAEWESLMDWNDSGFSRQSDLPIEGITWFDAVDYCNRKSVAEGLTPVYEISDKALDGPHIMGAVVWWDIAANGYRLLTEAEWEFACKSGSQTAFANGEMVVHGCDLEPVLDLIGWYCGNSRTTGKPVRRKAANAWNLYDMHGNVKEWCWDWYGPYPEGSVADPVGAENGLARVCRGGSFGDFAHLCRSAARRIGSESGNSIGLRLSRFAP